MPKRIQRKRTKGWKMPEGAVYVGRPTKWGNPFAIGPDGSRENCVGSYKRLMEARASDFNRAGRKHGPAGYPHEAVQELRGKDLACWCRLDQPCHADVLLEIANS